MMAMRWMDLTVPMTPGMTVWPGDPAFEIGRMSSIGEGDSCNTARLVMSSHTGTHMDAPWHVDDGWPRLDALDPGVFFGEAAVVELTGVEVVTAADLGPGRVAERILIKTRNSFRDWNEPFREDFVALAAGAARRLVDEGVRLVGVDGPSVGRFEQDGHETHRILLERGIAVVEGLRLGSVQAGRCQFVVLPLRIAGGDGAPCRAFAGLEDGL